MADVLIDVIGDEELLRILLRVSTEGADQIADEVNQYFLNVLRAYPPKKSVSRKQAYEQTFFSDKQRRWFFANLNAGTLSIPYRRTQALSRGWQKVGSGTNAIIANEVSYASLVMGPGEQSRHPAAIGWKTTDEIVEERRDRALEIAKGRMDRLLKG